MAPGKTTGGRLFRLNPDVETGSQSGNGYVYKCVGRNGDVFYFKWDQKLGVSKQLDNIPVNHIFILVKHKTKEDVLLKGYLDSRTEVYDSAKTISSDIYENVSFTKEQLIDKFGFTNEDLPESE